jgi:hypothetical protein
MELRGHLEFDPVLKAKQGKAFFSEEKKQKTFYFSGVCAAWKGRDSVWRKSFGSFLQKRTPSRSPRVLRSPTFLPSFPANP